MAASFTLDATTVKKLSEILRKVLMLNGTSEGRNPIPLEENEILFVVEQAFEVLKKENTALIEIDGPLTICGDTHGQFNDVIRLFELNGWPPQTRYLFLGKFNFK